MSEKKVGTITLELSNEDKILFPKSKITKGDMIEYYERIAPFMIPHIKNRPLTMHRYPSGIHEEGFYQKDAKDYFPDWIAYETVKKVGEGSVRYVLGNNAATLVYLANLGMVTPHVWLSTVAELNDPDRMIFDLDPAKDTDFSQIKWAARELHSILQELDITPFCMTTGSRGIHVVVPLVAKHDFDEVKAFARDVARILVNRYPEQCTLEVRKDKRKGRIFVDVLRNEWAQTGVAPYGVRALEGAPVATPIEWDELASLESAQKYTLANIFKRLGRKDDPWKDINRYSIDIKGKRKKLDALLKESEHEE